jgi:L,D-peptidoglycan transpeptidase YkuD (ErfK/YbiS/YcfS/YnhG family)
MGWCHDVGYPKKYNRLVNTQNKFKCEKLNRYDYKYDLFIPIKYNFINPKVGIGSAIFIHLTRDYKPTAGCIALSKKDFLIMLKIIKKNSKIKIL